MSIQTIAQWMRTQAQSLRLSLFPPVCLLCRLPGQNNMDICAACQADLALLGSSCNRCAEPLAQSHSLCGRCQQSLPMFDHVFAPYLYTQPITRLITGFKFRRQASAGHVLGNLLAEAVSKSHATEQISLPDCLLPVPLHPWRQIQRGFNQSAVLAKDIGKRLSLDKTKLPVDIHLLQRIRKTQPQLGLSLKERRRNLEGAFKVKGKPPRHIALVDDVMTSGSTVNECARLLKRAGCETVQVWVVARAERPK